MRKLGILLAFLSCVPAVFAQYYNVNVNGTLRHDVNIRNNPFQQPPINWDFRQRGNTVQENMENSVNSFVNTMQQNRMIRIQEQQQQLQEAQFQALERERREREERQMEEGQTQEGEGFNPIKWLESEDARRIDNEIKKQQLEQEKLKTEILRQQLKKQQGQSNFTVTESGIEDQEPVKVKATLPAKKPIKKSPVTFNGYRDALKNQIGE